MPTKVKTTRFEIRASERFKSRLKLAASVTGTPAAVIVTTGTEKELNRLARKHPALKRKLAKAA